MKRTNVRKVLFATVLASTSVCLSSLGFAATLTWNKATGTQTFNDAANWGDGTLGFPNAVDDIADMSTLDLTATQTINVTQAITLGELRTGDTAATYRGRTFNGAGSLKFEVSSGTAKLKYGFGGVLNASSTINLPVELKSNTEFILDLQSSSSRNLYLGTGALTGAGDMIINSATRGIVAIFTDTYDLSNYTGTFKYTSNGGGNMFQLAGNGGLVPRNARLATLEMSVATAGGSVWIFDGVNGASLELGALRGDGVIKPFATSGTLRTGYLSGTNNFSGVLENIGRFGGSGLSYEKAGANSTQIFSGANIYAGTTTVSAGTLLVNGTHTGGGAYSVASGATLGGIGSIGASVVTVDAGGFLAPGASIESLDVGGATINGTLSVQYQGAVGAGNDLIDLLNVAGGLDITNATLDFSGLGGALDDSALIFAKYGTLTGTQFASVTGLLPLNYAIDYAYNDGASSNNIALVQVPEPCSLGLAGVMLLGLCFRRSAPRPMKE
jgi:autotransporter-associated beta strand protein